jgi:hypothetical protein
VAAWLSQGSIDPLPEAALVARTEDLIGLGFKNFDALHLASAEAASAEVLLTVDTRFRKRAERLAAQLHLRVTSPLVLVEEVSEWTT